MTNVLTSYQPAYMAAHPGADCNNCACKLDHDDSKLYPGFYCQNSP